MTTLTVEKLPVATNKLWQTIRNRLQNKPVAQTAIGEIEENKSQDQISNLAPFLDVEMLSDETFKQEVQQLANEAMNQDKDVINIHVANAQSSPVVGKQEGRDNTIIGTQINYNEKK